MPNMISSTLSPDDGLRLLQAGLTTGGHPIVSHHNPELIAHVIAVKKERQLIRTQNIRKFEDFNPKS